MKSFELKSEFKPSGDQPQAIDKLIKNIDLQKINTLLGVTGSGKTFTIANVIEKTNMNTLIIAHNKTLAGQLYSELKEMFPNNNVGYFTSYFDFYQPEAYLPGSDTYIEKSSQVNREIEMHRIACIYHLLSNEPTIIVSSVASIYPTASPENYEKERIFIKNNMQISIKELRKRLIVLEYTFNAIDLAPGTFRIKGDVIDIAPPYTSKEFLRISMFGNNIESITLNNTLTSDVVKKIENFTIGPSKEYIANLDNRKNALENIRNEMVEQVKFFNDNERFIEAQRIEQRTLNDIESIAEFGICNGIENYASQLEYRDDGSTPYTLFNFFKYLNNEWLLVIDESHITLPQIRGMHNTDKSRKKNLVEYGFRLPSSFNNRPLNFDEFMEKTDKIICVSATPNEWEVEQSNNIVVEQIVRPTGLLDPIIEVRTTKNQMDDLVNEIFKQRKINEKTFITVLTIKMAEELSDYLKERKIKAAYLHNKLTSLERTKVILDLRKGVYDCIVGINLLREGLDVPEVSLVAILDADKTGLFRNDKSLIQMIGRAARNINGKVIMYADTISDSMKFSISETKRRRKIQNEYNIQNNVTPKSITKSIKESVFNTSESIQEVIKEKSIPSKIKKLKKLMLEAAKNQNYELAAIYKSEITELSIMNDSNKEKNTNNS